jgi:hypothetical protein
MFLTHPMELQGDVVHVESCFGPFGCSVNVGARLAHGLVTWVLGIMFRSIRRRC